MITKPTVLILGAGASSDFSFPVGRSLLLQICRGLSAPDQYLFRRMVQECEYDEQGVEEFRFALDHSGQQSVDAFLERRPEFLDIGKAAISCALIPYENEEGLFARSIDVRWYEYLFNRMNTPWEEFSNNKLSIITFNYDRSLEHYLFVSLKNTYGKDDEAVAGLLNKMAIVHIYGQLGRHPYLGGEVRPYSQTITREIVEQCVREINIVHEDTDPSVFASAHKVLENAEKVCFLGFGYDETNLKRLRLDALEQSAKVYGSARGFEQAERDSVVQFIRDKRKMVVDPITLGDASDDVLRVLRKYPILQRVPNPTSFMFWTRIKALCGGS